MNNRVHNIALAALLHDIGKFWSRTGKPKPYDAANRANYGDTYLHALWSGTFIEQFVGAGDIARWARNHHKANSVEELIISLADHLASGERETDEEQELGQAKDAALVHILATVSLGDKEDRPRAYLPMTHHGAFQANAFMPRDAFDDAPRCYPDLWEGFEKAAGDVRANAAPIETWLALMRRFTSRIPAATPNRMAASVPDISLYEHSRVTAAIAACLAADDITEDTARSWRTVFDHQAQQNQDVMKAEVCQLLCGDLSGVQEFLYAIPRKGAAKTLRARSFILQLVSAACAEFCCREAGVPPCNILYNGGGRFYLLAPKSADIAAVAATLNDHVQDHFGGTLAVIVGATPVLLQDFLPGCFSEVWRRAGEQCAARKARKYTARARRCYDAIFGNMDDFVEVISSAPGGDDAEDRELSGAEVVYLDWGRRLTNAQWLVRTEVGPDDLPRGDINRFFQRLGCEYHLVREQDSLAGLPQVTEICQLNAYTPYDTVYKLRPRGNPALTYRFIANYWPIHNGEERNHTFEELAAQARGAKKLAVFRADVDNLGLVFTCGLKQKATAGRVAMLSQALADFFEGFLNKLCQEKEYINRIGVIYAGGDDLFLVGAWDAVMEMAVELASAFKQYACQNPAFSLSGGVVLIDDHVPVRHFAELAGEAEDKAKAHERYGRSKDALTLFDMPFGSEELPRFLELKDQLLDLLDPQRTEKPLAMGFLRKLYDVWDAYQQERETRERQARKNDKTMEDIQQLMHWQRWRWMLVYSLREFIKKKDHAEAVKDVQQRILDTRQPVDDRLGMPLRWVELLLKKEDRRERRDNTALRQQYDEETTETATTTERI